MFLTAIVFFVILGILVCIHELGHFTVARWIGVHVEEFGFGLPPRIWGKKIGKTIYSLNWLPIGGFVKLAGEDEANIEHKGKVKDQSTYFWARSKKERAAILLAGVAMNFMLAVGITTYLLNQGVFEPSGRVHVEKVAAGSPAELAGLQKDDVVLSAQLEANADIAVTIRKPADLIVFTNAHRGEKILLTVARGSDVLVTPLTPRTEVPAGQGPMGVAVSDLEKHIYPLSQAPVEALKVNAKRSVEMFTGLADTVAKLVQRKPVGGDVAGPIGIAQVTGQAVKFGFNAVLEFMSILSLNLAVLNILPIPALDGGRLMFIVIEKITGRKVNSTFERTSHQIGMVLLLMLVVLISINDIMRLARGGM